MTEDRHKKEEMLCFGQERIVDILESIPAFVYLQAPDYSIRFANRRFRDTFGHPEGKKCYEVIHNQTEPCGNCPTFKVFDSQKIQQWEWRDEKRNRTYMVYDNFLPDTDGSPLVLEMGVDITEFREAAAEVIQLRNMLGTILNSMPSQMIVIDIQERVVLWNSEAEKHTGIKKEEVMGQLLEDILPIFPEHREIIRKAVREKKACKFERLAWKKEDTDYFYDVTVYPFSSGVMEGSVIRMDDISERILIEEMMIQSEKMISIGGLAAGMAHEINNPLGGILQSVQNIQRRISNLLPMNTEIAKECGTDLKTVRNYLEQRHILQFLEGIRKSGERAARIVDNMLRFSSGGESQMMPVNLSELLDKTVELASHDYDLQKKYDFRHIEVIREIDPDLPEITCIATEIEQVLLNILRNAAQAMFPARGFGDGSMSEKMQNNKARIILRLYRKKEMAVIEVEDNGPGMDEKICRRVFEPFFTTKPVGTGTGLGLSISYYIVSNNHRGTISVTSEPGKGAKFMILLPEKQEADKGAEHISKFI